MAKYAEGSIRLCEEMCSVSEICVEHTLIGRILNPFSSPWPFAQWGLDIVDPFLKAARNKKYLLVGTDYHQMGRN